MNKNPQFPMDKKDLINDFTQKYNFRKYNGQMNHLFSNYSLSTDNFQRSFSISFF